MPDTPYYDDTTKLQHLLLDSKRKLERVQILENRARYLYERYRMEKVRTGRSLSFDMQEAQAMLWIVEYIKRTQSLVKELLGMPEEERGEPSDAQESPLQASETFGLSSQDWE